MNVNDKSDQRISYHNIAEDMIDEYLDDCINNSAMCTCERCRIDVKVYALNHFPPRYAVTTFGAAISRVDMLSSQYQADIITAIMQGIVIVKQSPRH